MSNRRDEWLEELDELINRLPDLGLPDPIVNQLIEKLDETMEEVQAQFELRSTDWEA